MSKMPTPQQRPDLYDDFDYAQRPEGWKDPVQLPPELQKKIDEKQSDGKSIDK